MSEFPSTWKWTTLQEVVTHYAGGDNLLKLEYSSSGIPVLTKGDIKPFGRIQHGGRYVDERTVETRHYHLSEPGDYLLTTRDLTQAAEFLGLLAPVPDEMSYVINQGANTIRLSPAVDGRFVVYWCNGPIYRSHIKAHYVGSTQIHIRKEDFLDAPLLLPPLAEQSAIAAVLGALDDKIEANRRIMGSALDLLSATWSQRYSTPPPEWERYLIGDVVSVVGGSTPRTSVPEFWNGPINWATPKDLSKLAAPVLRKTERSITSAGLAQISSGLLPSGTVLLSSRAPIGYLALARTSVAVNQGFIAIPPGGPLPPVWLIEWLRHNMSSVIERANGTTFQEISKANFRPMIIAIPPFQDLHDWTALADPLFERVVAADEEMEALAALRDALLPKLLSGELRVRDAESLVEEAV